MKSRIGLWALVLVIASGSISTARAAVWPFSLFAKAPIKTPLAPEKRLMVRKALVQGVDANKSLRDGLAAAIGDARDYAHSRIEARRRARDAQDAAEQLLRSEGYYDYAVDTDVVDAGDGGFPQGVLKIDPGPRTNFNQTNIQWLKTPPAEPSIQAAFDALDLKSGAPARAPDVLAAQGRVLAALESRGYADARADEPDVVVDHADRSMNPTFQIDSGELVHLGDLTFMGKKVRTRPKFVKKLAPWKKGAVYNPKDIALLERRLLDTGVYDSVTVVLAPTPEAQQGTLRPVEVNLVERAKHSLDFTAGYSTTEGSSFDVQWSDYNRFHSADTLTYEARLAQIDSRIGVSLSLPDWISPGETEKNTLQAFRNVTPAYTERGEVASVDLTRKFTTTAYISEGFSATTSTVVDKELGAKNIDAYRLLGVLVLDATDNPLDPHKGWKFELHVTPTEITGDEKIGYIISQITGSTYLSLGKGADYVLAARAHVGSIYGGAIPAIPAEDRFFAGGGGSVRGYAYQTIGPHYPDNTPKGGLSIFESSFEVRQRFGDSPFGTVLFFDAGSVSPYTSPDFSRVSASVGVGFRYFLSFAPIRADLAFPLNPPTGVKEQAFQIYISIGQSF